MIHVVLLRTIHEIYILHYTANLSLAKLAKLKSNEGTLPVGYICRENRCELLVRKSSFEESLPPSSRGSHVKLITFIALTTSSSNSLLLPTSFIGISPNLVLLSVRSS